MGVYTVSCRLKNQDVNLYRRLRTARLLELMQEISIAHTESLGMGREMTLDRGLLWIVIRQRFEIDRMPGYDEEITLETWPGKTRHIMFPRYYRVLDGSGNVLVRGSALWMLLEEESRKMAFPGQHGINIDEVITGNEIVLPEAVQILSGENNTVFTVPFSSCDMNGHMNNSRYMDLAENCLDPGELKRPFSLIETEYINEIRLHDQVNVSWTKKGDEVLFLGEKEKRCFRIRMRFHPAE